MPGASDTSVWKKNRKTWRQGWRSAVFVCGQDARTCIPDAVDRGPKRPPEWQMLSLVMFRTDMNRSEQENLYRTSRKLSLVPISGGSGGLQHPFDSERRRTSCAKAYEDGRCIDGCAKEDLVLSVLKSPINHVGDSRHEGHFGASPSSEVPLCADTPEEDGRWVYFYFI